MARLARSHTKQTSNGLTILTLGLIVLGLVIAYIASQAVTPEDAHLIHWGAAAAGGVAGWLIGLLVERVRG
jgi:hypothetical protein